MQYMFYSCIKLETVPLLNTAGVTNTSYMFYGCFNLQAVPAIDTVFVTNISYMFQNCYSVQVITLLNANKLTNIDAAFTVCKNLHTLTGLFVSTVVTLSLAAFTESRSLVKLEISGMKHNLDVSGAKLSAQALNAIYTGLATASAKTITVTGNYGAAGDSPSIATAKGWTVTG